MAEPEHPPAPAQLHPRAFRGRDPRPSQLDLQVSTSLKSDIRQLSRERQSSKEREAREQAEEHSPESLARTREQSRERFRRTFAGWSDAAGFLEAWALKR